MCVSLINETFLPEALSIDTLEAYIDVYTSLVQYLGPRNTAVLGPGPTPPDQIGQSISFQVRLITKSNLSQHSLMILDIDRCPL